MEPVEVRLDAGGERTHRLRDFGRARVRMTVRANRTRASSRTVDVDSGGTRTLALRVY